MTGIRSPGAGAPPGGGAAGDQAGGDGSGLRSRRRAGGSARGSQGGSRLGPDGEGSSSGAGGGRDRADRGGGGGTEDARSGGADGRHHGGEDHSRAHGYGAGGDGQRAAPGWGAAQGELASAESSAPAERARYICLRLLTAAPLTRAQLADALQRRGIPQDVAAAVLGRFAEAGLIDDAAFAQAWVESRHHGRGLARRALAAELRRRGVDTEEVQAAIGTLSHDEELATARRLVAQRAAGSGGKPQQARIRQLMGLLARKGYPAGMAYQVVREALEQENAGSGFPGLDELAEPAAEDDWVSE